MGVGDTEYETDETEETEETEEDIEKETKIEIDVNELNIYEKILNILYNSNSKVFYEYTSNKNKNKIIYASSEPIPIPLN